MSSTVAELRQGATAWIVGLLNGLLPALNADLLTKIAGNSTPPFIVQIGETASAGTNKLCVSCSGDSPVRFANDEKGISLQYKVSALIPTAGNDTSANFEIARQVAMDHLTTVFDDDALVLTPKISAGLLGTIQALSGERGPIVDIFPRLMADKSTVVRGWEMSYTVTFSIKTR